MANQRDKRMLGSILIDTGQPNSRKLGTMWSSGQEAPIDLIESALLELNQLLNNNSVKNKQNLLQLKNQIQFELSKQLDTSTNTALNPENIYNLENV